jgi:hypothetical protein
MGSEDGSSTKISIDNCGADIQIGVHLPVPATNLDPVGAASNATAAETSARTRAEALDFIKASFIDILRCYLGYLYIYIYAYTHIYTYTDTYTYIYIYTYTHTHTYIYITLYNIIFHYIVSSTNWG